MKKIVIFIFTLLFPKKVPSTMAALIHLMVKTALALSPSSKNMAACKNVLGLFLSRRERKWKRNRSGASLVF